MGKRLMILDEDNMRKLKNMIISEKMKGKDIVLVNIGTDLLIGDSFGPLFGQMIKEKNYKNIKNYGNFDNLLQSKAIKESVNKINEKHKNDFIIATDATLISSITHPCYKKIGFRFTGVSPGAAFEKDLPKVGNMSILYAIDTAEKVDSFCEDNYRLGDVYKKCRELVDFFDKIEEEIDKHGIY